MIFSWRGPGHPRSGGAEIVTHEHAKAWVKAGHTVTLFTSSFTDAKTEEMIDGIRVVRASSEALGVKLAAYKWYKKQNEAFDVVFDHFHGLPFFTPLYVKEKKVAFIHEVTKEVWKLNNWAKPLNLLPALLGPLFEPWMFKLMYTKVPFITVSESTKKDLTQWNIPERNITVIHNGVITLHPKSTQKEHIKTILFVGALSKDKGIEEALKAFQKIHQQKPDWQFWIAGKGDTGYVDTLQTLSRQYGIDKQTTFFGFVSQEKKFELMSRAHILINPSHREGWGLVNIEANAMETPVVGYDVVGVRDSVQNGKTGILVPFGDSSSLAQNIIELVSDEQKYKTFAQNAKKWSDQFTWEKATKVSLEYLQNLIKK